MIYGGVVAFQRLRTVRAREWFVPFYAPFGLRDILRDGMVFFCHAPTFFVCFLKSIFELDAEQYAQVA